MPALTRAAARRGETLPPAPAPVPAPAMQMPHTPAAATTEIIPNDMGAETDTETDGGTPRPTPKPARVPRKLTREDTIVEISVSGTGQGTHIRWIRPGMTANAPDEVVDLEDKVPPLQPPAIVNAYPVPLPIVEDPFATPAPQPQPTTPPRIQRHPRGGGGGGGGLPPARRILHASGESFYQIILPSKDVQDILMHANASSVDLYSAFRPFTVGAEDEEEEVSVGGGGFDFTPVPSSAARRAAPAHLNMNMNAGSLGSPFHSEGNQPRVFGSYPPVLDASPLAQASAAAGTRMATRNTPLRLNKHIRF